MIGKTARSDNFKVGLVTAACVLVILIVGEVLRLRAVLAAMGPIILFLGYFVSEAWTPAPEWSPSVFWSVSIIFTTLVELAFAYFL